MKKELATISLALFLGSSLFAMPLTVEQKTNEALEKISLHLQINIDELKTLVLENSLDILTNKSEPSYKTKLVLTEMRKKFPHKKQKDLVSLVCSSLLSQTEKK